jgi:transcriptional regulator with XRE-family HTH domain
MTPDQFREWRRSLGLKQKEAAERLGLKKRMIQYYEKGDRDGRPVEIPKYVRLACYALQAGIGDFDGKNTRAAPPIPGADDVNGVKALD